MTNINTLSWPSLTAMRESEIGELLAKEGQGTIFEDYSWFENFTKTCASVARQQLLIGAGDGASATVLPLRKVGFTKIESLSNFYAALFGPLTTDLNNSTRHAKSIVKALNLYGFGTLRLHPISAESRFWSELAVELVQQGHWVDRYFAFWNWYLPATGQSWTQYLADRPSRLRNTIQRSRRRLEKTPGYRLELTDGSTDPGHVIKLVHDFVAVYEHSWKRAEPFPAFIPGLCMSAHSRGQLRLGVSYLEGKAVAAQIWLHKLGTTSIFKLAYDEQYARQGVGTVLTAALFEQALDKDRASEVDFLAGNDSYKAEWMSSRRARQGLIVFNPRSISGLAAAARHYGGKHIRNWIPATNRRKE